MPEVSSAEVNARKNDEEREPVRDLEPLLACSRFSVYHYTD